jgi:hypothetical protein
MAEQHLRPTQIAQYEEQGYLFLAPNTSDRPGQPLDGSHFPAVPR